MITYFHNNGVTSVFLDGKYVGDIERVDGGYQYVTKCGKYRGEVLPSIDDVKLSLESDE